MLGARGNRHVASRVPTPRCANMHEKMQNPKLGFGVEKAEVGLVATKCLRCSATP
jgi:hypothetical protein